MCRGENRNRSHLGGKERDLLRWRCAFIDPVLDGVNLGV